LLSAIGIKLNTIAKDLSIAGDNLERRAIANTGIKCRRGLVWEEEESTNPLGLGQWKRVEAESTLAYKTHRISFLEEFARSTCCR
jgi:DNA mismatch repair protein MutH